HRGRLGELVQLRPPGRGGQGARSGRRVPRRLRRGDRPGLAEGRRHGRGHQRRVRPGGARPGRPRVAVGAGLRRGGGDRVRRGAHALLAAEGAPPEPPHHPGLSPGGVSGSLRKALVRDGSEAGPAPGLRPSGLQSTSPWWRRGRSCVTVGDSSHRTGFSFSSFSKRRTPASLSRSSLTFVIRPRARQITTTSSVPKNSHGAVDASVASTPTATPRSSGPPPSAVANSTATVEPRNTSGGLTTSVSRSAGRVANAASAQPAANPAPASTGMPSQRASSPNTTPAPNMTTMPPRPVRATVPAAEAPGRARGADVPRRPRTEPPETGDAPPGASRTDDELMATSLADQAGQADPFAREWPARRNLPLPRPGQDGAAPLRRRGRLLAGGLPERPG